MIHTAKHSNSTASTSQPNPKPDHHHTQPIHPTSLTPPLTQNASSPAEHPAPAHHLLLFSPLRPTSEKAHRSLRAGPRRRSPPGRLRIPRRAAHKSEAARRQITNRGVKLYGSARAAVRQFAKVTLERFFYEGPLGKQARPTRASPESRIDDVPPL